MIHLVCEFCWNNVFDTEGIQAFWTLQQYDFRYETTFEQIALSAERSCNWCMFLTSVLPGEGSSGWPSAWTPKTQLSVDISEAYVMSGASPKGLNLCQLDFASEDCGIGILKLI